MFNKLSFSRPTRAPTNLADRRNYQGACDWIFVQVSRDVKKVSEWVI
jgi:hypothetical protein